MYMWVYFSLRYLIFRGKLTVQKTARPLTPPYWKQLSNLAAHQGNDGITSSSGSQ